MKKIIAAVAVMFIVIFCLTAFEKPDDKYLVLVNKTHQLREDWGNRIFLVVARNTYGEEYWIESETCQQYLALREELLKQDIHIELDSAHRSAAAQQELWDWFAEEYGEDYAKTYVAAPGYSEHQTGLAIDIYLIKDGKKIRENDDMLAEKEIFAKIHELLPEYGFILRYPEGKEEVTGYAYEPWHLRYVGSPKTAKEITVAGFTLEEYLGVD